MKPSKVLIIGSGPIIIGQAAEFVKIVGANKYRESKRGEAPLT